MISVIILNWNNAPDTLECLTSVYESDDEQFEVIVADNGSKDDSVAVLKAAFPQAKYLCHPVNLGFAEGNNRAIRLAMEGGADYIFLLNNDAILAKNTLSLLRRASMEHPNAAALGPKIFFYDEPLTIWYGGGEWDPQTALCKHTDRDVNDADSNRRSIEPTQYVCGCALFSPIAHLEKVGLMDSRYFLNWEEIDWCYRMRKAGFDCLYVPQAKAWHKVSRSFIGGKRGPMWFYFFYRNRLLWLERHLSFKQWMSVVKRILWPEIRFLLSKALFSDERPQARAALTGYRDYLCRRFGKGPSRFFKN